MVIDLKQIFCTSGMKKEFEYSLSGAEFPENGSYTFDGDVQVSGSVYNRADVVHMDYSVKFTLNIICDRCLEEVRREYSFDFGRIVVKTVNNENDEYIISENDRVDVDKVVISDLLLSLPTKMLCRDDCAGLCPVCGGNLNDAGCKCREK